MSVKIFYPDWKAICPKCHSNKATLTEYLNYAELPQEQYTCPDCGLRFYHVNLHVGIMTKGNALWDNGDYKKFYEYAIHYCTEQLKII